MFYLSAFILSSVVGIALGSGFTTYCNPWALAFWVWQPLFGQILPLWLVLSSLVRYLVIRCHLYQVLTVSPPHCVGVDLFDHIKNMMNATVPAWVIHGPIFGIYRPLIPFGDLAGIAILKATFSSGLVYGFHYHLLLFLSFWLPFTVNAIYTIIAAIIASTDDYL